MARAATAKSSPVEAAPMASNHMSFSTAAEWAKEAGDFESPPHSGLSELENGQVKSPRPGTFIRLGEINFRTHACDFHGVTSRKIRNELQGSQAICGEDGEPWGPAQFWECHAGLRSVPEALAPALTIPAPTLTDDQVDPVMERLRQMLVERFSADLRS
jgi:hypothetical protein